jgi:gliding motility-associated lipoprotein GldD
MLRFDLNKYIRKAGLFCIACIGLFSCNQDYLPKPASYPRIDYPAHEYKIYRGDCPFHSSEAGAPPCWLNVDYKLFNAKLHLSYFDFKTKKELYKMTEDAHGFAYKHSSRAEDISESIFNYGKSIHGVMYEIEGNTASSVQFYATDSVSHYLRGALYFNTHPKRDSLDPVIRFLQADIDTMLHSLKWK